MVKAKKRPQKLFKKYIVLSRDSDRKSGVFKSRVGANKRRDRLNKSSSEDWYVHGIRR